MPSLAVYSNNMKQVLLIIAAIITLASCSSRKGYFSIEGRFLNMNQGEIYIYSPDGIINGIDTIKVNGGRFAKEIPCRRDGMIIMVFPNYSQQPIFAEEGESVDIKADASHLKQMEVTGTDDNKLMTDFRKAITSASPPEALKLAEHFVRDNPSSPVAIYLIGKYFAVNGNTANLKKAAELLSIVGEKQPKNGNVIRLKTSVKLMLTAMVGDRLPQFKATDINGKSVSNATLKGRKSIIVSWASWSSDSQNMLRRISSIADESEGKIAVVGINLDGSRKTCKDMVEINRYKFPNICDEQLFDSKLLASLGIHAVPDNIITDASGKIVARSVSPEDMERYLK